MSLVAIGLLFILELSVIAVGWQVWVLLGVGCVLFESVLSVGVVE